MSLHCCEEMTTHLNGNEIYVVYTPKTRSYGVKYKKQYGGGTQQIYYCPWCGTKLPEDLAEKRWQIAIDEQGYIDFDDPNLPKEFKTDEWWKKRNL